MWPILDLRYNTWSWRPTSVFISLFSSHNFQYEYKVILEVNRINHLISAGGQEGTLSNLFSSSQVYVYSIAKVGDFL